MIKKDKSYYNNNNKNLPEASDKIKKLLDNFKVGPDGKRIIKNTENKSIENKKKNINKIRQQYEDDDYYSDSFIDDGELEEDAEQVNKFFKKIKKVKEIQKKNEFVGDVEVANYDTIQEEEEFTRKVGKKEDEEELKKIRAAEEEEEDEDDY